MRMLSSKNEVTHRISLAAAHTGRTPEKYVACSIAKHAKNTPLFILRSRTICSYSHRGDWNLPQPCPPCVVAYLYSFSDTHALACKLITCIIHMVYIVQPKPAAELSQLSNSASHATPLKMKEY
eukprot:731444-Pelagomonas_calceolata.AAC.9